MPIDLFINWSSPPTYFFQNGEQRVANLSADERNDLGTLRITEDGDGYGIDSLDVKGTYQFKRLELEKFKSSLQNFPTCFGTDFEEVSLVEVTMNDDATEKLIVERILKSSRLKSLYIKNVTFTVGMGIAICQKIRSLRHWTIEYKYVGNKQITMSGALSGACSVMKGCLRAAVQLGLTRISNY